MFSNETKARREREREVQRNEGVKRREEGAETGETTPEMLEKCRTAGRQAGVRGATWGKYGGRPKKEDA